MRRSDAELGPKRAEFSEQKTQFTALIAALIRLTEDTNTNNDTAYADKVFEMVGEIKSKYEKLLLLGAEISLKAAERKTQFPAVTSALTHLFEVKRITEEKRQLNAMGDVDDLNAIARIDGIATQVAPPCRFRDVQQEEAAPRRKRFKTAADVQIGTMELPCLKTCSGWPLSQFLPSLHHEKL
eukprot:3440739-Rhodomonas_salina.1